MPSIINSAPAKCILFGEHAVVYGFPAIAIPVQQLRAKAIVTPNIQGKDNRVTISAPDIQFKKLFSEQDLSDVFSYTLKLIFEKCKVSNPPSFDLRITSTIPIASGMGSGASIAVATIRAVSNFLGIVLSPADISALAFEVEKLHHGNPSGIDNTVVALEEPIFFIKDEPVRKVRVKTTLDFVIADTGIRSSTLQVIADVARLRSANQARVDRIFAEIGNITLAGREALQKGHLVRIGNLMNQNHEKLKELGVSHSNLDLMAEIANQNGAYGAKLTGAGKGGNIISLVEPHLCKKVSRALFTAGAKSVFITKLTATPRP